MPHDLDTMAANGSLPASRDDRERFTPSHYLKDGEVPEGAPVYLLAPLTVAQRRAVHRECVGVCGMFVSIDELRDAMVAGAEEELEPEEAAAVTRAIAELRGLETVANSGDEEEREKLLGELRGKIGKWQSELSRAYAPLRKLLQAYLTQLDVVAEFTVRACIRDWENVRVPYARKGGFVTAAAMAGVPDRDLEVLLERCQVLRELTPDREPDSASP